MTKIEYKKCEIAMYEGIAYARRAKEEYSEYEKLSEQKDDPTQTEIRLRQADQHYGEAIGINQALAMIGFKHEEMKTLGQLI